MTQSGTVLGLVGSPNREGRTYQIVASALEGAAKAGAKVELVQMADHVVDACKDCLPWVCQNNLKCTYDDPAFELLSDKILNCGALVLGTPIYWWDTSGMVKYLILKVFRVFARSAPVQGLPALGIGVAGGTGNGLVSGLRPVYHFFQMMQMRALEPLPATRFNFAAAQQRAGELGTELAGMARERKPFASYDARLEWYDSLPYLGLDRAGERRLLAALTTIANRDALDSALTLGLARADELRASGKTLQARAEVAQVYEAGVKAFEAKQG